MPFVSALGWIGAILLALCGLPQLVKSIREGHSNGMSWLFLLTWFVGEICMLAFVTFKFKGIILLLNYLLNVVVVGGILWYKIKPRSDDGNAKAVDNPT